MTWRWVGLVALPTVAQAQGLSFPSNGSLQAEVRAADASYALPTGAWIDGQLPSQTVEGVVIQQAWRIEAAGLTTLQLLRPLREQLADQGYATVLDCETNGCGGFDFRFATPVLPPPDMQVNLGDFRFLSAQRQTDGEARAISLMVSRTASAGWVQVTYAGAFPDDETATPSTAPATRLSSDTDVSLEAALDQQGRAILHGLAFQTGSSQLADGNIASLADLADYLRRFPDRQVALVGHTDAEGSLEGNIALSKRRAGSVLERLVSDYGVPRRQLAAEGMGYLSPIANNLRPEGREANRRVEVIVTSTAP